MKNLKTNLIVCLFSILALPFLYQPVAFAAPGDPGGGGEDTSVQDSYKSNNKGKCYKNDGDIKLSVPLENGQDCLVADGKGKNNPIYVYLGTIIRFLSAGVGIVVILMIVVSGVQYMTSAGNPDAVKGAKKRLTNAILALILFLFMAAILNFLVPGGLL